MAEATAGALQIVQTQQNLVGNTIAGGASAVIEKSSGAQIGILEQIRNLTLQSFRKTSEIASTLANTLFFQKTESRKQEDQSSELEIEKNKNKSKDTIVGEDTKKSTEESGKFSGTMFALGALTTKLLKPFQGLLNFFKKILPLSGVFTKLGPIATRLGPLASGLLRLSGIGTVLFLLVKYSDEIIKALTPVFTAIASVYEKLKPAIDFILEIIDGGIKIAISGIGSALSIVGAGLEGIAGFITGLAETIDAATRLDWEGVKKGLKNTVMAPINFLKSLGKIVFDFIAGIIDALPLPKFLKDKFKGAIEKKETTTGSAGDTAGEASLTTGETIDTSKKQTQTSQALDDEYYEPIIEKEKPKTINQDKPKSAVSTVVTMRETGGEKTETTGYTKDQQQSDMGLFTKKVNSIDDKIKSIEDQYGFPSFEVGNPDYDNAIADEAKTNPALGKAWRKYKALHREKFKTIEKIKEIEGRPLEEPTKIETKFDKIVTKRELKEEGSSKTSMNVVNAPVNSNSVVNNSQPTINYMKMNTGVDSYTEKLQYSA